MSAPAIVRIACALALAGCAAPYVREPGAPTLPYRDGPVDVVHTEPAEHGPVLGHVQLRMGKGLTLATCDDLAVQSARLLGASIVYVEPLTPARYDKHWCQGVAYAP
jgi:hypothetical protein